MKKGTSEKKCNNEKNVSNNDISRVYCNRDISIFKKECIYRPTLIDSPTFSDGGLYRPSHATGYIETNVFKTNFNHEK